MIEDTWTNEHTIFLLPDDAQFVACYGSLNYKTFLQCFRRFVTTCDIVFRKQIIADRFSPLPQWRIQEFPWEGAPTAKMLTPTYRPTLSWLISRQNNCMKLKKMDQEGGACPWRLLSGRKNRKLAPPPLWEFVHLTGRLIYARRIFAAVIKATWFLFMVTEWDKKNQQTEESFLHWINWKNSRGGGGG